MVNAMLAAAFGRTRPSQGRDEFSIGEVGTDSAGGARSAYSPPVAGGAMPRSRAGPPRHVPFRQPERFWAVRFSGSFRDTRTRAERYKARLLRAVFYD